VGLGGGAGGGSGYERGRSNSALLSSRLRAASEMQRQGAISKEEKAAMKHLILNSDPTFREQFDTASKTGDLTQVKKLLQHHALTQDAVLNDMTEMHLDEEFTTFLEDFAWASQGQPQTAIPPPPQPVPHGQMSSLQPGQQPHHHHQQQQQQQQHRPSVGFGSEFMRSPLESEFATRKRQASRSAPAQGMAKVVLGAGGSPSFAGLHSQQRTSQSPHMYAGAQPVALGAAPPKLKHEVYGGYPPQPPGPSLAHAPGSPSGDGYDDDRSGMAKTRKNERERKRRLAVSQGFDELYKLLKRLEEERQASGDKEHALSVVATSKLDKASILRSSIEKINMLESQIQQLRKDNERLHQLAQHNN